MLQERRNEVTARGSEFQRASIGHHGGGWGHPIDHVCRPLLSVCLGRCKDLALTTAVAALIDKGAIQGMGSSNQPLGLMNLPDALSQTFAAATPTSDELASMLEKLGDAKADLSKVVFLMHPSTAADLMKTRVDASSGALVLNGFEIHGLPVFVSSNVTEDTVIAMDPSYSRIVYFAAPKVVVVPFRGSISGVTHVHVLNAMDYVCTNQSSVVVGSA